MEDRGLVEVGEVGHVLTLLKLGGVDLTDRELSVGTVLSSGEKHKDLPAGFVLS